MVTDARGNHAPVFARDRRGIVVVVDVFHLRASGADFRRAIGDILMESIMQIVDMNSDAMWITAALFVGFLMVVTLLTFIVKALK